MIALRRIVAVSLGIAACGLAIWLLFIARAESTIGDAEFLVEQLDNADIYEFIYDDVALLVIQESSEEVDDPVVDFARFDREIVDAAKAVFPPEWIQEQTETAIREFLPYIKSEEDSFSFTIPIGEIILNAGPALKAQLASGRVVEAIYDDVVNDQIDETLLEGVALFGREFTSEELINSIRVIAPPSWVREQLNGGIDAVLPYLAGETEGFTVVFDVSERTDAARAELVSLVSADDLTGFIFDEVLDPVIAQNIGADFRLPFNLSLTDREVEQIVREALPASWVREQADEVMAQTAAFIVGDTETFNVLIPLAGREDAALDSIGRLMDSRLEEAYRSAPLCTAAQVRTLDFNAFANNGISCRPPGVTLTQVKAAVDLTDYQAAVREEVGQALPDFFQFNEKDLRDAVGEGQSDQLDDLRRWLTEGFTVTHEDLEGELAKAEWEDDNPGRRWKDLEEETQRDLVEQSDTVQDLRAARERIRGGFTYDEVEFLDDLGDNADDFLEGRTWLRRATTTWIGWGWAVFGIVTIGVGLLGGRRLYSKLIWGAAVVLIAGLIALVGSTPAGTNLSDDRLENEFEEELAERDITDPERVLLRKGKTMALDASGEFLPGFRTSSILMVGAGGVMLLSGIAVGMIGRRKEWGDYPTGQVPRSQLDLPEPLEDMPESSAFKAEPHETAESSMDYGLGPAAETESDEARDGDDDESNVVDGEVTELPVEDADEPDVVDAEVTELPVEDADEPADEDAGSEDKR
jgi:hypothetical protein